MNIIKEFDYSIRSAKMILPALLFGCAAAFFFHEACTNDRGLIINGLIRLNVRQGTIFYYVMAGLSSMLSAGGVFGIISGLLVKQKLVMYSDGMAMPGRKESVRFYYGDIASVRVLDIYKTRIIEFVTKDSRKYSIPDSKLGPKAEFDEVYELISRGVNGNHE
jgi:hypothetical protein